jgi:phytoene dehydrogenase-like protein
MTHVAGHAVVLGANLAGLAAAAALAERFDRVTIVERDTLPRSGEYRRGNEAWTIASGADLGYPAVPGPRPPRWRLINAYFNRLVRVAHRDPVVAKAFMEVNGMVVPPQHLMRPRIVTRVFAGGHSPAHTSGVVPIESTPGARR